MTQNTNTQSDERPFVAIDQIKWDCDGDLEFAQSLPQRFEFTASQLQAKGIPLVAGEDDPEYENFLAEVVDLVSDDQGFCIDGSRVFLL